jgi:predicted ATP-grasp superfamily ATP-dependent carboligase
MIKDKNGKYFLIECNPKIWGTTEITTLAGMNMVQQHVDIFIHKTIPETISEYKRNLVYKYWFPECLFHLFHKPFTLRRFAHRLKNVFSNHNGTIVQNNLKVRNIRHLLGIVVNALS